MKDKGIPFRIIVLLILLVGTPVLADGPALLSYRSMALDPSAAPYFPDYKIDMSDPDWIEGLFGPTDISGVTGNRRLAVGINTEGTVTVLKWPRPSFYDQLQYRTLSRDLPLLGARENDGAFFGLVYDNPPGNVWLRDSDTITQEYKSENTNILVTTFTFDDPGIEVTVLDFVHPELDILIRRVQVEMLNRNGVAPSSIIAFFNLTLCDRKIPYVPIADWLMDDSRTNSLSYSAQKDQFLQITAVPGLVNAVVGFAAESVGHQCGVDSQATDAYNDASDGALSGQDSCSGRVDGAMTAGLDYTDQVARQDFFVAFGRSVEWAEFTAETFRENGAEEAQELAEAADRDWLGEACLPATDDSQVLKMSKRALLSSLVVTDEESGAIGASIATQPPYGPDWPRDGAYINLMLDKAGYLAETNDHNYYYIENQGYIGNWDMCTYGDGVPAGPLFLETDTMALAVWSLANHWAYIPYLVDSAFYLLIAGSMIGFTADFFTFWKDPSTGLPLPAFESDYFELKSTLLSAGAAWYSLNMAMKFEEMIYYPPYTQRWEDRKTEVENAIWETYYDSDLDVLIGDPFAQAYMIYPFEFLDPNDSVTQATAEKIWEYVEPILNLETPGGSYLGLLGISLAKAWKSHPDKLERLTGLLDFLVEDLPISGTDLYGECFVTRGDTVETRTGIPHVMTGALTYLLAVELYGQDCAQPDDDDDDNYDDDDNDDFYDDDDDNFMETIENEVEVVNLCGCGC